MGSTAGSEVPWASRWSMAMVTPNAGTMRMPPPTPNSPDRKPATKPTTAARASRERACSAVLSAAWVDTRAPRRVCRVCCPAASGHKVGRYRRSVDSLKVILTGEHLFAYYRNMPETPSAPTAAVVCTEVDGLSAALCELAGHIHAATAELVWLLGRLDAIDGWQGVGIRSLGHWASSYLGIVLRPASLQAKVGRHRRRGGSRGAGMVQAAAGGPGRRTHQPDQMAGSGAGDVGGPTRPSGGGLPASGRDRRRRPPRQPPRTPRHLTVRRTRRPRTHHRPTRTRRRR